MKMCLVIVSMAMLCLMECFGQERSPDPQVSYGGVGGYSGLSGLAGYSAQPSAYGVQGAYGGQTAYGGQPAYGGLGAYGSPTAYGGQPAYGGLGAYGSPAAYGAQGAYSQISPVLIEGNGPQCSCPISNPKICGSDNITYNGWCNFQCATNVKQDLRPLFVGDCSAMRTDSQNDKQSDN